MTKMTRDEVLANPASANAAIEAVEKAQKSPLPVAALPPSDLVTLPGGLVHKGHVIRSAVVRELTGEHEEALARAIQSKNPYHFLDTLLAGGTVRLGQLDEHETRNLLPDLLIGDRDEIILGIRVATYGDTVEVFNWECPKCDAPVDKIEFSLSGDVDRKTLADPASGSVADIGLRNGASARVRLVTGTVLTAAYEDPKLVGPQRDDIILSKCVESYTDRHGNVHHVPGFPSIVRSIPIPDRRKILKEISDRQPGPRYNEIVFKHDGCGEEVTLALGITDLFRDLIVGLV